MNLAELQEYVAGFVAENRLETDAASRLLDLLSELGEVAKEVLKGSQYGKAVFEPTPAWTEEVGDALFSLVCLANTTGVNLETALDVVLEKYAGRLSDSGEAGSGR